MLTQLVVVAATLSQMLIDRAALIDIATQRAPEAQLVRARANETHAGKIGAGVWTSNPAISGFVGPRVYPEGSPRDTSLDFFVQLSVPLDITSASTRRADLAEERSRGADAEAELETRRVLAQTLILWIDVRDARARLAMEQRRVELDEEVLRIAEVKRNAGTVGDTDVSLAKVLVAEARARFEQAAAEADAKAVILCAALGLQTDTAIETPALDDDHMDEVAVDALVARLPNHPLLVRADHHAKSAELDLQLQGYLARPVPRFTLSAEKAPEYAYHAGLDVPLPVIQRNQTARAVAAARIDTVATERTLLRTRLEADLRAAYARMQGARRAHEELAAVAAVVDDSEHLATRSYELGQGNLFMLVAARREAAAARALFVDSTAELARAEVMLQWTGDLL